MPDEKDESLDTKINDALANLAKKIDEQGTKHEQKLSALDSKVTSLADDEEVDDEESWASGGGDDEEVVVKKSELKTMLDTAVKKATEAASKTATKTTEKILEHTSRKAQKDEEAFKDFPYLLNTSEDFNQRFLDETKAEMQRRVSSGRSNEDPDLLYDAAAVVHARGRKQGWLVSREDAEMLIDAENRRGEAFTVRKTQKQDSNKPTAEQIAAATQFGLKPERFAQLFGKTSKSRFNSVDRED